MTNQLLERDLDTIEENFGIKLGRSHLSAVETDDKYYPQIQQDIRTEAALMAPHYETFYSLEKTIRRLITDTLEVDAGADWWTKRVPKDVKSEAKNRQEKEKDTGFTPRSIELIDFCTFGELGEIIKQNWDLFGAIFSSIKAVEKVMASLNTLRGPIAHCSPLADDEKLRLTLTVRDWFRLME